MKAYLAPLLPLQRFFLPVLVCTLMWAIWKTVVKKDPAVGLGLYVCLVVIVDGFLNTGIYLPGLEKGSIRYSELCAVVLFLNRPAAAPSATRSRAVPWLIASYFLLLFLSALRSDPLLPGIFEFRTTIIPQVVAFLLAKRGLDSPHAYRRFLVCMTALVIIVGLFNFWDLFFDRWIMKSDMLDKPIYYHNRQLHRLGSLFLNPNYLGAFIALVFPSLFVWTLNERQPSLRILGWSGLLSLVFCLVETQSRGPLAAFLISIVFLAIGPCGEVSRQRRVGFLCLFVAVFTLLMPGFYQHAIQRFDELDGETAEGRTRATTWLYTLRIIAEHPLLGIGYGEGQFMKAMDAQGFSEQYGVESLDAPHNSYLQVTAYAGIPALLAFLFANGLLLLKATFMTMRRAAEGTTTIAFGLAVGILGFLVSIFPDLQLFTPNAGSVYWVFAGLLLSLVSGTQQVAAQLPAVASLGGPHPALMPMPSSATSPVPTSWWTADPAPRRRSSPSRQLRRSDR